MPDDRLERAGQAPVCGLDEAGRGPWAGPVYAAAVVFRPGVFPPRLNDSKKLSALRREELAHAIRATALAWSVCSASASEIDNLNVLKATGLAMQRCLDGLGLVPGLALVDGSYRFALSCPVQPVVGGDGLSVSIAAASILAKTARDSHMQALDLQWPGYGFARHKGYGVRAHAEALAALGPCPEHRRSFKPIRALLDRTSPKP